MGRGFVARDSGLPVPQIILRCGNAALAAGSEDSHVPHLVSSPYANRELNRIVWRHDEERGRTTLVATTAAFAVLGIDPQEALAEDETEGADEAADAPITLGKTKSRASRKAAPRSRAESKQAQLIAMLRRAKGATIDEIVEALGWQPHTVRGAIAGALKKKLGLAVTSRRTRDAGGSIAQRPERAPSSRPMGRRCACISLSGSSQLWSQPFEYGWRIANPA